MGSKWRSWTKISLEKTLAFRTRISLDSFATLAFDNFLVNIKSRQTIKTQEEFDSDKKKFLLHLQHIVFYSMCLNCIGSKLLTTNRLRKIFFAVFPLSFTTHGFDRNCLLTQVAKTKRKKCPYKMQPCQFIFCVVFLKSNPF